MRIASIIFTVVSLVVSPALAAPKVVVSIKPLQSLVEGVMEGVGKPELLVSGSQSPHDFSLKPSQVTALKQADVVVFASHGLEMFLQKPIAGLDKEKTSLVDMSTLPGITLLPVRDEPTLENASGHDDHDHDAHEHDDHDHEAGGTDPHIWLDPQNAIILVKYMGDLLAQKDSANAALYKKNTSRMIDRLTALDKELTRKLTLRPAKNTIPYLTYHDAYQYFEKHYNLPASVWITRQPEHGVAPKAALSINESLKKNKLACAFTEPQFDQRTLQKIADQSKAEIRVLNPEGTFYDGKSAYENMLRDIANHYEECLKIAHDQ